jgi:CDP-glycerol glycerophosphotransferase
MPIKRNRIVVCNIWGFGDNTKYVTEELARRLKNKTTYEIIFITNHPNRASAPNNVQVYKTNSFKAILALATAKVWVDNNRKEPYIRKRKGQYYIQTWHGGIALKKIEKDYENKLGYNYITNAKRDSKMTDLYVSNSRFCTNLYRNSFWYTGEIMECGSPRNDILINPDTKNLQEIKTRLGIKADMKVAIYAPTYRENNDVSTYVLDFQSLLNSLETKFDGNWVLLVRLHPLVASQSGSISYNKKIMNATNYRDIYELMAISDVLITDYSNIMFEFSLMKKPVFLYANDIEEYENERGFYFPYNRLPYDISKSEDELIHNIETFNLKEYSEKVKGFLDNISLYETGFASKIVVDRIIEVIEDKS